MTKQLTQPDEQQICDYLIRHPDFFSAHQYVLLEMELHAQSQGLPNLALQQQRTLRQQNIQLKTQLANVAKQAIENERVFRLFSECQRQLWSCRDFKQLAKQLANTLCQSPHITVCELLPHTEKLQSLIATRLSQTGCYLGRLSQSEHDLIWPPQSKSQVQSVALYLIGEQHQPHALLAFASDNAAHFCADNDNLFINEFITSLALRLKDLA